MSHQSSLISTVPRTMWTAGIPEMMTALDLSPMPHQIRVLIDPAPELAVEWPRGSGASTTACLLVARKAIGHPRSSVLVLTPDYPAGRVLQDRIAGFLNVLGAGATVSHSSRRITLDNGSLVSFVDLVEPALIRGHRSDLVVIDQAERFSADLVDLARHVALRGRLVLLATK